MGKPMPKAVMLSVARASLAMREQVEASRRWLIYDAAPGSFTENLCSFLVPRQAAYENSPMPHVCLEPPRDLSTALKTTGVEMQA